MKQAAWPNVWNGFVDGVIIPYLKQGHGNVRNKPPLGGMVAMDMRVDHLMRWAFELVILFLELGRKIGSLERELETAKAVIG